MVKLIINAEKTQSEIIAEGNTMDIVNQLAEACYRLISRLNIDANMRERIKLFHGALLLKLLIDGVEEDE